ncbi:cobalt-precorrin-6A reductase [Kitasatospora kifunensis]|uniref:Precorrin-6A/cobalt-precorrin-6A reductase n=1 Tax=Kitasatospora kifunensis TaxID=58351 RepID=A0A7W7QZA2_KITKI|nr:cobalt-precorrin-6A reductase [Kitasatospora kifunensis]MBB4922577.1 precorrin-6A/cobalt-precorrin-6A reductase [Kitasatospora kifunensis]
MRHILILGGTTEGRRLAQELAQKPGIRVTSSLAGRVSEPRLPPGEVRVGGFGGAIGLADWLREHQVDTLVDATHPFAQVISRNAAEAASATAVPLLALRRPGWQPVPGDRWHLVDSLEQAAAVLPTLGRRALLTTGRLGLSTFARVDGVHLVARSVEPPDPPLPPDLTVLLSRGPFQLDDERAVFREHRIDVLVTKDSGGAATAPKLTVARELALPVLIVRRPALPDGIREVSDVAGVLAALGLGRDPSDNVPG